MMGERAARLAAELLYFSEDAGLWVLELFSTDAHIREYCRTMKTESGHIFVERRSDERETETLADRANNYKETELIEIHMFSRA